MISPNSANVVVLASNYNPSIISKEWLYQKGIFTDTVSNFIHTPVFALIESEDLSLVVDERKLQITTKKINRDTLNKLITIATKFVDILPETPYKGLGLNYHYTFSRENCDLGTIFSPDNEKLSKLFSATYELGATVVFKFEKFIVTFLVSPSLVKEQQIRATFNFHSNIASLEEVKERLSMQSVTLEKAETIVKELCKNA